jgi:hypothetical protein
MKYYKFERIQLVMYSYIGVLVNDSGTFDIADPMINPIFCEQLSIPRENQTILKVRNALAGIYDAIHILNDSHEICDLLILHQSYTVKDLDDNTPLCLGTVCGALAHAVCVVDERYHFDPTFSYYKLEREAFYDGDEILKRLPSSPYPAAIKKKLSSVISSLREKEKQPTGEDIYTSIQGYDVWDAFCSNKIYSSHWSVDVCNRLDGCIPAAVFKGGVVSKSEPGFLTCYTYRNSRGMAFAIRIPLEQCDFMDADNETADIIKFPERTDPVTKINFSGTEIET